MLVKVSYDELAGKKKLAFNLYTGNGDLLFWQGDELTPDELDTVKYLTLYRHTDEVPVQDTFNHEGKVISIDSPRLTVREREELFAEESQQPIYGHELTHSFVTSVQYFWDRMAKGATPDIALCEVVRDKLVSEVTSKVNQVQVLSQLRVRDEYTYSHILDVTALSIALAIKAGFNQKEVREIALAGILHDMGKLLIPKSIMFKPSRLTEKEFQVMKLHPELGYKMIKEEMKLPDHIARPALEHQEMYGGGGYPQNIKGDEIHPYSHIVKIADVYDALTSKRPYKEPIPSSKAIKIMLSEGDKSFHPELLRHFLQLSNYYDHAEPEPKISSAG